MSEKYCRFLVTQNTPEEVKLVNDFAAHSHAQKEWMLAAWKRCGSPQPANTPIPQWYSNLVVDVETELLKRPTFRAAIAQIAETACKNVLAEFALNITKKMAAKENPVEVE